VDKITASTFSVSYTIFLTLLLAIRSSEIFVPLFQRFSNGVPRHTEVPRGEKKYSVRKFIIVKNENLKDLLF